MKLQVLAFSQNEQEPMIDSSSRAPQKFVTNPEDVLALKGEQIIFCFQSPKDDSRVERVEKLGEQTTSLGEFTAPTFQFPKVRYRHNRMVSLQKWQGYVLEVLRDSLLVRLIDLSQKGPDEEAEIPFEEISPDDQKLIRPGAIFYWNIGYLDFYTGQRVRASIIRFQRLPAWSKEEIDEAKREAERLQDIFDRGKKAVWFPEPEEDEVPVIQAPQGA